MEGVKNALDTKTMIHIGVEAVVIGGVTFWLNGRVSSVQRTCQELQERLQTLESVIQQQNQIISRHEAVLRQVMGAPRPSRRPQKPQKPQKPQEFSPAPTIPDDYLEEEGPQEVQPEQLDEFLEEELSDILQERECDGDKCVLKSKKSRKKRQPHGA